MLEITIPDVELFDERTNEFKSIKGTTLKLEHSLVSLSKWESKWKKPFLTNVEKSYEETVDYIKCMTLTQNVNPELYDYISQENMLAINNYIGDPMTATTFGKESKGKRNTEIVTAELVYYWMIALNIPFECQKWHLNKLLTLVRVCNIKNQPDKKMSKKDTIARHAALNAQRRKQYSKG